MFKEIEIEINETTQIIGNVSETTDSIGDHDVIGGIQEFTEYEVNDLKVYFLGINVTHLLNDSQKLEFEEQVVSEYIDQ